MAVLSDNTKINKVDGAFSELVRQYMSEGATPKAEKVFEAFKKLDPASKVRLFEILTKPDA